MQTSSIEIYRIQVWSLMIQEKVRLTQPMISMKTSRMSQQTARPLIDITNNDIMKVSEKTRLIAYL